MTKRSVVKKLGIAAAAILLVFVVIVVILFFPLMGKKHLEVWSAGQAFDVNKIQTVEKQPGKDFTILLITDTQLWSNPKDNKRCFEEMEQLVQKTSPDLIATVGDNVSGATSRFLLKDFIKEMDSFGRPWTAVFGNHDNEIPMTTLNWQGNQYMKSEYCLFQKGPSNLYGCGNYVVNITENQQPVYTLFMFDNGRYTAYEDGSKKEIYMGYEQIAWYEWNVKGIERAAGKVVPSMTFSHFAQPEFRTAVEKYGVKNEADGTYTIPTEHGFGSCVYLPGAPPVNSGFFQKCKELGSTTNIICGHDHENNATVMYDGITMTYGLKTGPSPAPWVGAKHTGGTTLTIHEDNGQYKVKTEHIYLN